MTQENDLLTLIQSQLGLETEDFQALLGTIDAYTRYHGRPGKTILDYALDLAADIGLRIPGPTAVQSERKSVIVELTRRERNDFDWDIIFGNLQHRAYLEHQDMLVRRLYDKVSQTAPLDYCTSMEALVMLAWSNILNEQRE